MIAAEFGVGQVLWSMLWFYLFMMWVLMVLFVFADIIRNSEMNGMTKALWFLAIIALPYLGVLMYIAVNGRSMSQRQSSFGRSR